MNVYIVRHAEAMSSEENPDRPLTDYGESEAKVIADLAAGAGVDVGRILHSGKTRARQTAEILADALDVEGVDVNESLTPSAEPSDLDELLSGLTEDVMFVGHLPHAERLVSYLVTGLADAEIVDLGTANMVCVRQDNEGEWRVRWQARPELL